MATTSRLAQVMLDSEKNQAMFVRFHQKHDKLTSSSAITPVTLWSPKHGHRRLIKSAAFNLQDSIDRIPWFNYHFTRA